MADGTELMIIVTTTFAQAIAGSGPAVDIITVLTLLRFLMGVGIGGDYPLSAVITSEFAATRSRGRLMTAVFASQGWGYLGEETSYSSTSYTYRCQLPPLWHWSPSPDSNRPFWKTRQHPLTT
jgi:MFS family permease